MMKLSKKRSLKSHRYLSLIVAIPVMLWSLSGILHPIMANFTRPEIAKRWLPPEPLMLDDSLLSPSESLAFHSLGELHQLKLITLGEQLFYIAITPDQQEHYINARSGELSKSAQSEYAEKLARSYLDDDESALVSIEKITEFGDGYGYINRLLPVFRVKLDRPDGVEVVIDTRTKRLASADLPSGRYCALLFDWFHRWSFLGDRFSVLRITVVSLFSLLAVITGFYGVLNLYLFRRKKGRKKRQVRTPRKWHRRLGVMSALFYFMFGVSGFYHIVVKYAADDSPSWISKQSIPVSEFTAPPEQLSEALGTPIKELSIAVMNGRGYYRCAQLGARPRVSFLDVQTGKPVEVGDEDFAKHLALEFSGYEEADIEQAECITKFRKDYGFIFKRLPVWRVHFKEQPYWHYTVDTADAHMAMRLDKKSLIEALSFINLHKFHFLDGTGKKTRDWVGSIASFSIFLLSVMGLWILSKKKGRAEKR